MNTKENRIALIPARLTSSRLPEKLLLPLGDKEIIVRTYETVMNSQLFNSVKVICDNERIADVLMKHNCHYELIKTDHQSGTDRIAEAAQNISEDIIINIQGDEPFISAKSLEKIISLFDNQEVRVASLKTKFNSIDEVLNPNNVKVVSDPQGRAMYFSRSPIPYQSTMKLDDYFRHLGIYGFKKNTLLHIASLSPSKLECIEKLENLRILENGIDIYLAEVKEINPSIDTMEDYILAQKLWVDK